MTSVKTTMAQTSEMMEQLNTYMVGFFKEHGSKAAWAWETESNQIKVKKALLVKALSTASESDPESPLAGPHEV